MAVLIKRIEIDTGYPAQRFTDRLELVKKIDLDIDTDTFKNEAGIDDDKERFLKPAPDIKYVL